MTERHTQSKSTQPPLLGDLTNGGVKITEFKNVRAFSFAGHLLDYLQ